VVAKAVAVATASLFPTGGAAGADVTSTYIGSNGGAWSVAGNWSPATFFPNAGNGGHTFDVIINVKAVTAAGPITVEKLTLSGGTISANAGTLAFQGGGTQTGAFNGASGTTLRFDGGHNFQSGSVHADSVVFAGGLNQLTTNVGYFATNTAVLAGAELRLGIGQLHGSLTVDGGTISSTQAPPNFGVDELVTWNSGSILAGINVNRGININTAGTKMLGGELYIPTFPAPQTGTWNGGEIAGGTSGRVFVDGNFNVNCDNTFTGAELFNNARGTVIKSGGTGTTSINAPFNNYGTVAVNVGTLSLKGGGTFVQGSFTGATGTTVRLNGAYYFQDVSVSLANLVIDGGNIDFHSASTTFRSLTLNAGTSTFAGASIGNLTLGEGNVFANFAPFTCNSFDWIGSGDANGTITTAKLNLIGSSLTGRTLSGTITATDAIVSAPGTFVINGSLKIPAGGSFQLSGSNQFDGASGAFVNAGTFTKTSTSQSTWAVPFTNSGSVNVQAGLLRFSAPASHTGSLIVAPGATGALNSVTAFEPASSVNASTIWVESKGNVTVKGAFKVTDLLQVGGQLTFAAGSTPDFKGATVASATGVTSISLNFNSGKTVSMAALELNPNCTLAGTDSLTISDHFLWTGGALAGSGTVTVMGPASFTNIVPFRPIIGSRTLVLNGDTTMAASVILDPAATLAFGPAATVAITRNLSNSGGTVNNDGAINLTGGTGTTSFTSVFNNSGTVSVSVGTLSLPRGGTHSGQLVAAPGTTLQLSGPHSFSFSSSVNAATVAFSGTNAIDLGGSYAATATTIDRAPVKLSGPLAFAAGATLALTNAASLDLRADAGSPVAANLAVSLTNSSAAVSVTQHLASLSISGSSSSTVTLSRPTPQEITPTVLSTRALGFAGKGNLQINDNALVVDYDPAAASPLPQIRSAILSGYDPAATNHFASGVGISSTAAANNSNAGVGYAEAADALSFTAGHASFLGEDVDPSTVLVRYTLAGDVNLDGAVDFLDLARLAQSYNVVDGTRTWPTGDFNYDGNTDFLDLAKLAQNYNAALPSAAIPGAPAEFSADLARAFATVPEPSGVLLALVAACLAPAVRRRRKLPL
jgi:hypothetical protein